MSRNHPPSEDRWHDKRVPCPHCGDETSPFSKHLHAAKLNNHLYGAVERQQAETDFVKKARTEREPA